MKKESTATSIPEVDSSRITFVKSLCSRIQEAIQDIQGVCEKVVNPKPEASSLGKSEGIGLFLYIRDKESALKEQYPQFTDDEIVSILLSQWSKMDDSEKQSYCPKINEKKQKKSKKEKKMEKMLQKLTQTVSSTEKGGSIDEDEGLSQSMSFGSNAKSKYFAIEEEEEEDSIPKKKMITTALVFAEDLVPPEQKKQIQEEKIDSQENRVTPCFQKLEFNVITENKQQKETEQKLRAQIIKPKDEIFNQNSMQIQPLVSKRDHISTEPNNQAELNEARQENQEITPIQKQVSQENQKEKQLDSNKKSQSEPQNQRQVLPSEIPPSDDVVETASNQIQSTKQCNTCFGASQTALQGITQQIRSMDYPVLIQYPSESNSVPLPSRSRDQQAQNEKPSLPKIEHDHQKYQINEHREKFIVSKIEIQRLLLIDPIESKIQYKQHNSNPFFDQKDSQDEAIHPQNQKLSQQNIPMIEAPQLNHFTSAKQQCEIHDEQKESGENIIEEMKDKKLAEGEEKQDNSCTKQQFEFE